MQLKKIYNLFVHIHNIKELEIKTFYTNTHSKSPCNQEKNKIKNENLNLCIISSIKEYLFGLLLLFGSYKLKQQYQKQQRQ